MFLPPFVSMDQISKALDCIVLPCLILKIAISLLNLNFIEKSIKSSLGLGQDFQLFLKCILVIFVCICATYPSEHW